MKPVVKMEFGSTVYGTRLPTSDSDFKGVYIPDAVDILRQRIKPVLKENTKKDPRGKNTADDVDVENFSYDKYLTLLAEGQTVALDMLFVPEKHYIEEPTIEWREIQANKDFFIHKGVSSFVGYCQTQAAKYGIKGSRVSATRQILHILWAIPNVKGPLSQVPLETWHKLIETIGQTNIVMIDEKTKGIKPYLEVCNRKVPLSATVKYATDVFQRVLDEYGHRALQAESNENVDWKALNHAVRICNQAKELLSTGNITFPRPEAPLLLDIRQGKMAYKEVAVIIEDGLEELEQIKEKSTLRAEPDHELIELLISTNYAMTVSDWYDTI